MNMNIKEIVPIILEEDIPKFNICIEQVIKDISNGDNFSEKEITVGDEHAIANVHGYIVGNILRIDIKFRG